MNLKGYTQKRVGVPKDIRTCPVVKRYAMDPQEIIQETQNRLVALVNDRPFRFMDTLREEADSYVSSMKTFVGYTEDEILATERQLQFRFPAVFRAFLAGIGRHQGGLFRGSEMAMLPLGEGFRKKALQIVPASFQYELSSEKNVIFLIDPGDAFLYFKVDGTGDSPRLDAPVYQARAGSRKSRQIASSFAQLLNKELLSAESSHRSIKDKGGYFLIVNGRSITIEYPACHNDGIRPLDCDDRFLEEHPANVFHLNMEVIDLAPGRTVCFLFSGTYPFGYRGSFVWPNVERRIEEEIIKHRPVSIVYDLTGLDISCDGGKLPLNSPGRFQHLDQVLIRPVVKYRIAKDGALPTIYLAADGPTAQGIQHLMQGTRPLIRFGVRMFDNRDECLNALLRTIEQTHQPATLN